jgi:hypothetical protein
MYGMPDKIRAIVTHVNEDGTSGAAEQFFHKKTEYDESGRPIFEGAVIWGTEEGIVGTGQTESVDTPFFPGPTGHRFVVWSHMPEDGYADLNTYRGQQDSAPESAETAFPGLMEPFNPDHPGMHTTESIDYTFLVSGQVYLELDSGEYLLNPGDVVVQRGTAHAWRVRATQPSLVAAVLIGAQRK